MKEFFYDNVKDPWQNPFSLKLQSYILQLCIQELTHVRFSGYFQISYSEWLLCNCNQLQIVIKGILCWIEPLSWKNETKISCLNNLIIKLLKVDNEKIWVFLDKIR